MRNTTTFAISHLCTAPCANWNNSVQSAPNTSAYRCHAFDQYWRFTARDSQSRFENPHVTSRATPLRLAELLQQTVLHPELLSSMRICMWRTVLLHSVLKKRKNDLESAWNLHVLFSSVPIITREDVRKPQNIRCVWIYTIRFIYYLQAKQVQYVEIAFSSSWLWVVHTHDFKRLHT